MPIFFQSDKPLKRRGGAFALAVAVVCFLLAAGAYGFAADIAPGVVPGGDSAVSERPKVLDQVLAIVKSCADKEWHGCTCKVEKAWNRDTVYWDKKLVGYVKAAAEECGISHQYIHSGAGHDAQFASYMLPTSMIFVQSKDGLSHCEPEYS